MNLYLIKLKNILRSRYLFKILFIICLIYLFIYYKLDNRESIYNISDDVFYGKVISYKYIDDIYTITIDGREKLLINYKSKDNIINYGDYIKVYGRLEYPLNNTIPNSFNYKKYLNKKNIFYIVNADNIEIIKYNDNIIYDIKNKLFNRINKLSKSSNYVNSFILNNKSYLDKEIKSIYINNGILYLFSLSSIYLSIYIKLLYKILNKVSYNNYFKFIIILIILIIYYLIIDKSISILRYLIMFIVFRINKLFNLKIKRIDLLLIILIIISIINPYYVLDISFILAYLIIFFITILNKNKNKLYCSFLCFLVTFPIIIYTNYSINILSIILTIIYSLYISFIILPLSIISVFIVKLDNVLYYFINILESISIFINKIDINIYFSKPSIIFIVIYYILLILYMYNKKYIYLIITIILIHKYHYLFDNTLNITYLDVGQGDSSVITYKTNTILIDTGFNNNKIVPYLKSLGKDKINYLILTHGDNDHMGYSLELINNIKVDNIIFNCGSFNELESKLIDNIKNKNINYYSCIEELNINNIKFMFLNTKIYDNENDNSIVIYFNYSNYNFLFMGDASVNREKDILNKYNLNNIDFLKVGHHGSKTSSSKKFIDEIKPKYSVISVGKNNSYGHPNNEVLNNLGNSKIYRTDQNGSIMFNINNSKLIIKTYNS